MLSVALIGIHKKIAIFTGKKLSQSLFLPKFHLCMPVSSLKRDSDTGVFL